ncbi:MAG: hypothetical protein IJO14_12085, partial [Clostridia bacterium]|nr:hypothetical protein [Clostridia bacterium]
EQATASFIFVKQIYHPRSGYHHTAGVISCAPTGRISLLRFARQTAIFFYLQSPDVLHTNAFSVLFLRFFQLPVSEAVYSVK